MPSGRKCSYSNTGNPLELAFIYLIFVLALVTSLPYITPTSLSAFGGTQHNYIISQSMPFLNPHIQDQIISANAHMDTFATTIPFNLGGPGSHDENHFDACAFKESSTNIQSRYEAIKRQTIVNLNDPNYPFGAAWSFGELLHPIQDFYSHSNWAELGQTDKVDSGLGNWMTINSWEVLTKDIVPIELPMSSGWSIISAPTDSPEPKIRDPQGTIYRGLFTHGREGYKAGDNCPPGDIQSWNHDQLNKDGESNSKYAGNSFEYPYSAMHERSVNDAIAQTAHEWCRYLNLLKSDRAYGFPAVSIPMALWVKKDGFPHPVGTPCQKSDLGDKSVIVSISNIKVVNDMDRRNDDPGDLNLSFVLYKGDLTRSVRTQSPFVEVEKGANWPVQKLPSSLTMCLKSSDILVVTVQGWDDEGPTLRGAYNPAIFHYNNYNLVMDADRDSTLKGITFVAGGFSFGQGIHKLISDNIEVTFQISRMPACIPEGVTSQPTDTDKDKVVDSVDNCKSIPNPDQKDTDNDRIGDACDLDLKDTDNDGVVDSRDNCDFVANPGQGNINGDEFGDACQPGDQDNDGVVDAIDNCRWVANPDQKDEDKNGVGDACKEVIL